MFSIARKLALLLALVSVCAFSQQLNLDTQSKGSRWPGFGTDSGAANAYVVTTVAPLGPGLRTGSRFIFKAVNANTGASTLNVDGTGVIAIKKAVSTALTGGDINAGQIVEVVYDGTVYQCMTCEIPVTFTSSSTGCNTVYSAPSLLAGNCNILDASQFSGADAGAKVAAALAALPSSQGIVNACGLTGAQTITTNPFSGFTGHTSVFLGPGTWTVNAQIAVTSGDVDIYGCLPTHIDPTILKFGASLTNTNLIQVNSGTNGGEFGRLYIECNNNTGSTAFNTALGVSYVRVFDFQTDQCSGNGIIAFTQGGHNQVHDVVFNNSSGSSSSVELVFSSECCDEADHILSTGGSSMLAVIDLSGGNTYRINDVESVSQTRTEVLATAAGAVVATNIRGNSNTTNVILNNGDLAAFGIRCDPSSCGVSENLINNTGFIIIPASGGRTELASFSTGDFGSATAGTYTFIPRSMTVANLPNALTYAGATFLVTDSTTITTEGQACTGGSTNTAIAIANGTGWKCF